MPRTSKAIVVLHVISSVAILEQVWVNAVLAVIAMRAPDISRASYSFMQTLVYAALGTDQHPQVVPWELHKT